MTKLHHEFHTGSLRAVLFSVLLLNVLFPGRAQAINILINYDYDTNNFFFNNQIRKDALQAAANRYSAIITESLSAASLTNGSVDPRISFAHPGTGVANFQVSSATSTANDAIFAAGGGAANEYRGSWSIPANQFIVYAGARPLAGSTAGEANTGSGTNFESVFELGSSHLNRGFRPAGDLEINYLPMWGGAIAFDNDSTTWHFDHTTAAPSGSVDFYSIALHEIGHLLGLSTGWHEWTNLSSGNQFNGASAVATYNADNGTSLSSLTQTGDGHFQNGAYNSYIFQNASPNLVGTVGTSVRQDLLMDPSASFTPGVRRFELTNVDVAALRDVGWSTLPQPPPSQPGDYNKDGIVNAADYVVFSKGVADGNYATWRANFGESTPGGSSATSPHSAGVPEPTSWLFLLLALTPIFVSRRSRIRW